MRSPAPIEVVRAPTPPRKSKSLAPIRRLIELGPKAKTPNVNYTLRLSRRITLRDGRKLVTLLQAGDLLTSSRPMIKDDAGEHAARLLMQAAKTGERADIRAATTQVENVLHARGLVDQLLRARRPGG